MKARLIAFYLPQFHPIPENDSWWGRGFTEWTNVVKAKPLFRGHYQPHIPADLGFYDLRLEETRIAQAEMARQYSIEGFCYWHYWFHGKRLLERPFNEGLASGRPKFPFCLAWANESWSRRWTGEEREILQKQTYSEKDDRSHAAWLVKAFSDSRYIRVHGRPLFLIYRPLDLPDPKRTTDILRDTCVTNGLPDPYLLGSNSNSPDVDFRNHGFDGTLNFEPRLGVLPDYMVDGGKIDKLTRNLKMGVFSSRYKVYDYAFARRLMVSREMGFPVVPCIFVGWDNTPRRGENGIVMINATVNALESGLTDMVRSVSNKPYEERLVFVNAWNEWAEGNHLEPDLKNGFSRLEAIRRVNSGGEG